MVHVTMLEWTVLIKKKKKGKEEKKITIYVLENILCQIVSRKKFPQPPEKE